MTRMQRIRAAQTSSRTRLSSCACCPTPAPSCCCSLPPSLPLAGWADSSIASLRTKGLVRAKAGWTNVPPYLLVTPITSAAAKPGVGCHLQLGPWAAGVQGMARGVCSCRRACGTKARTCIASPLCRPPATPSGTCCLLQDVVFYGKFQSYVALYLGADLVLHFAPGPTGQPQVSASVSCTRDVRGGARGPEPAAHSRLNPRAPLPLGWPAGQALQLAG